MKKTTAFILIFVLLLECAALCFAEEAEPLPELPVQAAAAVTEAPEAATPTAVEAVMAEPPMPCPGEEGPSASEGTPAAEEAHAVEEAPSVEEVPSVEEATQVTDEPTESPDCSEALAPAALLAAAAPSPANQRGLLEVPVGEDGSLICYAACIPESEKDAIASQIQSSFSDGEIENPCLIDAEKKTLIEDWDDEECDSAMCWAAAISDTIWGTGWGEKVENPLTGAPFTSEDELMQYFVQSFADGGNRMEYGLEWFFDGVSFTENPPGFSWATLKDVPKEADALAREYCAQELVKVTQISYDEGNIAVLDALVEGIPVNVSIEFCDDEDGGNTHALAAMGIIVDPSAEGTDGYYRYILFANSDNSVEGYEGTAPDSRPNTLSWYPLRIRETQTGEKVWEVAGYSNDPYVAYTRIKSVCSLAAYGSEEAAAAIETDPQATKNGLTTQDLVLEKIFTSLEKGPADPVKEFAPGSSVWLNFTTADASYVPCEESFLALVTLKREADGETVSFYTECNKDGFIYRLDRITDSVQLNDYMTLSSGKYSVCVELNPASAENRLQEAYYLNNLSLTQFFTILAAKTDPAVQRSSRPEMWYYPILIPDRQGDFTVGTEDYGILVNMAPSAFGGLAVLRDLPDADWESVAPENYTVTGEGDASFRLTFKAGYLETLGKGTHRFRFTLGGCEYCCNVCCHS